MMPAQRAGFVFQRNVTSGHDFDLLDNFSEKLDSMTVSALRICNKEAVFFFLLKLMGCEIFHWPVSNNHLEFCSFFVVVFKIHSLSLTLLPFS